MPQKQIVLLMLGVSIFWLSGCDVASPLFVHSPRTAEFMPATRESIEGEVVKSFGQPQELAYPDILPLEIGGIATKINKISEDRKVVTTEDDNDWKTVAINQLVRFAKPETADPPGSVSVKLAAFDPTTKTLTFTEALPADIEVGGTCLIDAGRTVKYGQKLYMQHCVHCHGVSGDGKGVSAVHMNPHPRDFRQGKVKFTSTSATERARDDDLKRILSEGIAGTYMPSFKLLKEHESDALVAYIKFLAARGEFENKLCDELMIDYTSEVLKERIEGGEKEEEILTEFKAYQKDDLPGVCTDILTAIKDNWDRAQDEGAMVVPTMARPEPSAKSLANPALTSVENGHLIFLSKKAQCVACHGESGRGDGYQTREMQKDPNGKEYPRPGLHDDWGNHTPPRDLTAGIMRGGRRPVDIFRRIHAGVKGTRMLAFGGTGLKDEEIWDVVNYLLILPNHPIAGTPSTPSNDSTPPTNEGKVSANH
jgi:mono/diheme cytochrome c family protein